MPTRARRLPPSTTWAPCSTPLVRCYLRSGHHALPPPIFPSPSSSSKTPFVCAWLPGHIDQADLPSFPPFPFHFIDEDTTPEQQRGAYEALLKAVQGPSQVADGNAMDAGGEEPAAAAPGAALAAEGGRRQYLQPRVLGMACELLGRHAEAVPSLTNEAMNALVGRMGNE